MARAAKKSTAPAETQTEAEATETLAGQSTWTPWQMRDDVSALDIAASKLYDAQSLLAIMYEHADDDDPNKRLCHVVYDLLEDAHEALEESTGVPS